MSLQNNLDREVNLAAQALDEWILRQQKAGRSEVTIAEIQAAQSAIAIAIEIGSAPTLVLTASAPSMDEIKHLFTDGPGETVFVQGDFSLLMARRALAQAAAEGPWTQRRYDEWLHEHKDAIDAALEEFPQAVPT